jgi:hypothetical protein
VIAAVLFLSLLWWSYRRMFRGMRSPRETTPVAPPVRSATHGASILALEDDPDQWRATRGAWTALDERQLTRLLTDSAPTHRPATNSIDKAVPHSEQEDTP